MRIGEMKNYANAYEKWLGKVDQICMNKIGFPWNAICHDVALQREAYLNNKKPKEFVEEYLIEHKPYIGHVH